MIFYLNPRVSPLKMNRAHRQALANQQDFQSFQLEIYYCNEHLRSISQNLEKLVDAEKSTWTSLAWLMFGLAFAHNFSAWLLCNIRLA